MNQVPARQRPTVGDTVTIVQRVAAPADALVQPRSPTDSLLATLIAPPLVERDGDSVRIGYTVALWSPGRNSLHIPGPILMHADGRVDTLTDSRVMLDVGSVLPGGVPVESLVPRQARPWVERTDRSFLPFAVLLAPVLLVLAAVALWWRWRGPAIPSRAAVPIDRERQLRRIISWHKAGEFTLAVDHLAALLPATAAGNDWRQRVAIIRFQAGGGIGLAALIDEGLALWGDVESAE